MALVPLRESWAGGSLVYQMAVFVLKWGVLGGERFLRLLTKFSDIHTAGTVCTL